MRKSIFCLTLLSSLLFISCLKVKPTPEPLSFEATHVKITVKDTSDEVAPGAQVSLYTLFVSSNSQDTTQILNDTAMSDIFGVVTFDYSQYFDESMENSKTFYISASLEDANGVNYHGTSTLLVEHEKDNEGEVIVQ
ncbi:hypothetical protein SAMN05216474_2767 [Lishizhenia tianjinensis]|uniref:DUF11 domain-containing protein n=1 Tax=Lishizhenia tianjinensis TaxID=477690 RepID=A0A1I7BF41_9FLAO|nr:hypothetical protein [Lishizhenia tianjinensis]SFT85784.1 hypothetical protein SAMN05216474_2767 [Lishizhenia tianjinensis]